MDIDGPAPVPTVTPDAHPLAQAADEMLAVVQARPILPADYVTAAARVVSRFLRAVDPNTVAEALVTFWGVSIADDGAMQSARDVWAAILGEIAPGEPMSFRQFSAELGLPSDDASLTAVLEGVLASMPTGVCAACGNVIAKPSGSAAWVHVWTGLGEGTHPAVPGDHPDHLDRSTLGPRDALNVCGRCMGEIARREHGTRWLHVSPVPVLDHAAEPANLTAPEPPP